jgi:hypothetical protein
MKICSKCGNEKSLNDFYNYKNSFDGKKSACKTCTNEDNKKWYLENKEAYDKWRNEYKLINKEKQNNKIKKWREDNLERKKFTEKRWRDNNIEKISIRHRNWYIKNREKKLNQNSENNKKRMKSDPIYRATKYIRSRISGLLRGNKSASGLKLLDCSLENYKIYLEKQFRDGMSWENYGTVWHIDHIKPCSMFDLSLAEEQKKCFHYTNTQPLLATENLKKYNKLK